MIDPLRKKQNDALARRLLVFFDDLEDGLWEGDPQNWHIFQSAISSSERNWGPKDGSLDFMPSKEALAAADQLRATSIEPLGVAITTTSLSFVIEGPLISHEFRPRPPLPWVGHNRLNIIAPLTWHVCLELLATLGKLTTLIYDPTAGAPLAIERAAYARQQTELIRVEHTLWELAFQYGGPTRTIPHPYRSVLLHLAWHPFAHTPPGAWTLCIRCGSLLHSAHNRFSGLPRCSACMKETPTQRQWPKHAVAPHARGTWLLTCADTGCETVFEGRRHRRYCTDHTPSRLSPNRRLRQAATRDANETASPS